MLAECVCAAEQIGNLFCSDATIAVLTLHVFYMTYASLDYYSDYMKDEVKMMHGVLGKAIHECKILLGKPYGKVTWERQGGVKEQCVNFINISMYRAG